MISKDRYTHLGPTFCSCCFYRFERHFRKTKKGCSIPPISHKNYWGSLYCHEKVLKKVRLPQRYPEFPLPPGSMLCQVWKSCVRQWWSGMTKQTCDQHWIRRHGIKVSLFLWLIVGLLWVFFASLREKCPNTEFFLVRIQENTVQKKLRLLHTFHAVHLSRREEQINTAYGN